ncbi:hypothetical protein MACH17_18130 [Phaeobacter inhibens]|nr:hypothetical protein MACH17_18130 [Phaeobacter inhibens]
MSNLRLPQPPSHLHRRRTQPMSKSERITMAQNLSANSRGRPVTLKSPPWEKEKTHDPSR